MKAELSPSSWPPFASSEASRKLPTAIEPTSTSMPQFDNVMDTSSPVLMCEDSTLISVPFVACTTSGKAAILDPTQKLHPIPLSLQSNNAPMIHSAELNIPLDNLVPPMSAMLSSKQPLFSPAARYRRAPAPSHSPPINIVSTSLKHTIDVHLPSVIQPEMVTISANKGDRIKIVADAWHMETDCECPSTETVRC